MEKPLLEEKRSDRICTAAGYTDPVRDSWPGQHCRGCLPSHFPGYCLFLFCERRAALCKAICWENSMSASTHKRMETERFHCSKKGRPLLSSVSSATADVASGRPENESLNDASGIGQSMPAVSGLIHIFSAMGGAFQLIPVTAGKRIQPI